jgi:DNA helicase-2/ATP-dependent DNA helicase PcrA
MTVHASKGLEFQYVFVTGLEDGLFPQVKKSEEGSVQEDRAEEERRLFYVALTRARKKLYLSYTSVRTIFGKTEVNVPSTFLADIHDSLITYEERKNSGGKRERVIYFD